jgi:hypothetical protein
MVLALNTVSGKIADVSPKMLAHPKFKDVLVPVKDDAKPFNTVMYKPGTVEEKVEQNSGLFYSKVKKKKEDKLEVVEKQKTESNIDIEEEN